MITSLINDLVNFFKSVGSLIVLWWLLKLTCLCFFRVRIRLPRLHSRQHNDKGRKSLSYVSAYYEYRRYKLEKKYEYKLQKYQIAIKLKADEKKSSLIASLPSYLKIVK